MNAPAVRPIDTSTLGPIRVDPSADGERARIVRQALGHLAGEMFDSREGGASELALFARLAPDRALAKLGRLLK